jgi:hypothetical protein
MCGTATRGAVALPGSKTTSRRRRRRAALSRGEEVHNACEQFADHLINSVREMEARSGQNLEDLRVTNQIIRKVWAHFNMWVHESTHARDEKLGEDRLAEADHKDVPEGSI